LPKEQRPPRVSLGRRRAPTIVASRLTILTKLNLKDTDLDTVVAAYADVFTDRDRYTLHSSQEIV
jgi:hypothetical protein